MDVDAILDQIEEAIKQVSIEEIPEDCQLSRQDIEIIVRAAAALPKKGDRHGREQFKKALEKAGYNNSLVAGETPSAGLRDDPFEIVRCTILAAKPPNMSEHEYQNLCKDIKALPTNRRHRDLPHQPSGTSSCSSSGTNSINNNARQSGEKLGALVIGERSGGAAGGTVGVVTAPVDALVRLFTHKDMQSGAELGREAGIRTADRLSEDITPYDKDDDKQSWQAGRAAFYGAATGGSGGAAVGGRYLGPVGAGIGGAIGGTVGVAAATGSYIKDKVWKLFGKG